jgi:hypothetical protein
LVQCHQVALLLQIQLPHGSKVYETVLSTIACTMSFGTSQLQDLVLGNFCFYHFFYNLRLDVMLKLKISNSRNTDSLGANFISTESAAAFVSLVFWFFLI